MGSSMGGTHQDEQFGATPLDISVGLNIDLKEFPKIQGLPQSSTLSVGAPKETVHAVKFNISRDKFLQLSKDMKTALALLEQSASQAQEL